MLEYKIYRVCLGWQEEKLWQQTRGEKSTLCAAKVLAIIKLCTKSEKLSVMGNYIKKGQIMGKKHMRSEQMSKSKF